MSGSIEISTVNEQIESPASFLQLPDALLHPDFTRYYQDALHNPEHPNGWGNAVLLLDILSRMNSTQPLEAITVAQYQSPHKDPNEVDRPRLYKESLARAIVDLAQLTAVSVDVITANNLDKINGRVKWTTSEGIPNRDAIQAILQDVSLPNSLIALREDSEEINHEGKNGTPRRPSRLWGLFHKGDYTSAVPDDTRNEHLIKLGITTSLTPDLALDTNQILLLPQNYSITKQRGF